VDFDIRQWLLILGPIFIAGVLLHGYLRMRSGQNEIKMKLDRSFLSRSGEEHVVDEISFFKAELPNGGARLVGKETGVVNLDDDVPELMKSVEGPSINRISSAELSKFDVVSKAFQARTSESIAAVKEPAKTFPDGSASDGEEDQSAEETAPLNASLKCLW
jgi:FtsZ-interacting cell division protein ZipA